MPKKKDMRRYEASSVELYVHYQKQLNTINRELARCLYLSNKTRKTNSFASTPCIPLIIAYLELPINWEGRWMYFLPAPYNLLKRKALALTHWRIDAVVLRGGYVWIRALPPSDAANNMGSALIRAASWRNDRRDNVVGPSDFLDFKNGTIGCISMDAYVPGEWNNVEFGFRVDFTSSISGIFIRFGKIDRVTSITFTSDRQESLVDQPGQIAPYGSCGEIPGVAHFYPQTNYDFAPFDELLAIEPPTKSDWKEHQYRGKGKPSTRLQTNKHNQLLAKQAAAVAPPISDVVDTDYVALSSMRIVKRCKRE